MLKNIKIVSKSKANNILNRLKKLNKNAHISTYCTGKYDPDTIKTGSEFKIFKNIFCIYRELRYDSFGSYAFLKSVSVD